MDIPAIFVTLFATLPAAVALDFTPLFPNDGAAAGFTVRHWSDVSKPPGAAAAWVVKGGILTSEGARGCWLMSEKEYGDIELEYEFKLGPEGNSGLALRAPLAGDPAFDGLEMQMADRRYTAEMKDSEQTGSLYRALAPARQVYKPEEWNRVRVKLEGTRIRIEINGQVVQDADLSTQDGKVSRHDKTAALPLKDRPRRGHIGFQELSRGGSHVQIRGAKIRELPAR